MTKAELVVTDGSTAPTVSDIIDQQPMSPFQIWTMVLCGLVLVMDGFSTQTLGALALPVSVSTRIPVSAFGPIFSASLFGYMLAALATGPVADRWGRKWPIIVSTLAVAVFSILTARATSFNEIFAFRFLTGLGIGGAMPNVVALASEYAPKRLLSVVVAMLFCGMPLGSMLCGVISSAMLSTWGWQWVFYIGGILPIALSLVLIFALAESVQFMVVQGGDSRKVTKLLARISPVNAETPAGVQIAAQQKGPKRVPVKQLFTEGRSIGTILLWIPNFMNLLLMYFLINWLPALLKESGMSVSAGVLAISFYNFGGILGSFVEGWLLNGFGAYMVLLAEFGLCSLFIASLATFSGSFPIVIAIAFTLGFLVTGAQAGLNVSSARFYPTSMRSTGVGWSLGIGRIGSVVGPLIAGSFLSAGWNPFQVLLSGAAAALCAWIAILVSNPATGRTAPYTHR
jgi:AAHS family 4-hydroxybenzoate transporter-like MFS transporter